MQICETLAHTHAVMHEAASHLEKERLLSKEVSEGHKEHD